MSTEPPREVMRSYTKGLRVPTYIGQFRDGTKVPGGPYTVAQGVTFAVVVVAGYLTRPAWSHWGLLDYAVLVGAAWALAKAAGRVPETTRNPVAILASGSKAVRSPRAGTTGGRPVTAPRQRHLTGRVLLAHGPPPPPSVTGDPPPPGKNHTVAAPGPAAPPAPVSPPAATPFPPPGGAAPVSAVAQLLAAAGRTR